MANNTTVNKVVINNNTVLDLTDTTATSDKVLDGEVFYTASGSRAVGSYVDSDTIPSAICTTAGGTAAKVAQCSSYALRNSNFIQVIIANSNSASSALTLNINGTGAKPIYINSEASSSSNRNLPAGSYFVYYDGNNYRFRTDSLIECSVTGNAGNVRGLVTIAHGGTGATTASDARDNLELGTAATQSVANNLTTSAEGSVLDARMGLSLATSIGNLATSIENKGRYYTTQDLSTFYANVAEDEFEVFSGSTDFTSLLTNSKASGICFGFAVHNAPNGLAEGLLFNTSSAKLFSFRISSAGALSYVRSVTLTAV